MSRQKPKTLLKFAVVGGCIAALVIFAGIYLLGSISQVESLENMKEIRPTLRFTANGVITVSATIMALMLTLLSFSSDTDKQLKSWHYDRIHWITRFAVGTFVMGLVLLMTLNLPLVNAKESLRGFYTTIYYLSIGYVSLLGGGIVCVILLLYQATTDIIMLKRPNDEGEHLFREESS
ncbi:hypothetical protein [Lewinella sp. W8]|uniref:hypothetical protein n=1 Tax=Lewinella sp. W8 TaxID=2528208 RepID=UPI0010672A76|nr:hypothetical protein [Lewinella sp. W8]MTB53678.1 hypothetical protein [Lewinella sp. W8]